MMETRAAAAAVRGRTLGPSVPFMRVTTDTRAIARGDLFVALRGERFDGHDFVAQALERGAAAALVSEARAQEWKAAPLIAVVDPLAALGALAAAWRRRFTLPVVAIAGSNGKTSTKEMLAAIFRAAVGSGAVAATPGNLNNAIGVPLAVLSLRDAHRLAAFEIGMNHRGETRTLAGIVAPTIALVTNAQREHQEFMRSVAEVAAEHADAIRALPVGGTAIVNLDDVNAPLWHAAARAAGARVATFGLDPQSGTTAAYTLGAAGSEFELRMAGASAVVTLHVPGRHMIRNALAAAAAAQAAGVPAEAIVQGLGAFRPAPGRLVPLAGVRGSLVVDDTYNANPDSVLAGIEVLAAFPGERWLALGDMGEVGAQGPLFHREVGAHARAAGIERLHTAGEAARAAAAAFGAGATHHESVEALAAARGAAAHAGVAVLVKGSRFMRMERVVEALVPGWAAGGGGHP